MIECNCEKIVLACQPVSVCAAWPFARANPRSPKTHSASFGLSRRPSPPSVQAVGAACEPGRRHTLAVTHSTGFHSAALRWPCLAARSAGAPFWAVEAGGVWSLLLLHNPPTSRAAHSSDWWPCSVAPPSPLAGRPAQTAGSHSLQAAHRWRPRTVRASPPPPKSAGALAPRLKPARASERPVQPLGLPEGRSASRARGLPLRRSRAVASFLLARDTHANTSLRSQALELCARPSRRRRPRRSAAGQPATHGQDVVARRQA